MFDHLRIDQNSMEKFFPTNEKSAPTNLSVKRGSDFFSMLMEQVNYGARKGQVEAGSGQSEAERDFAQDNPAAKISDAEIRTENAYKENVKDTEIKDAEDSQNKPIDDAKEKSHSEIEHNEIEREKSLSLKKLNDKNNKSFEEDQNIILQLQGEMNIKRLMEITKALLAGDKKSEAGGFLKLFDNLKFNNDKSNKTLTQSHAKIGQESNLKNPSEHFTKLIKEIGESIRRELTKAFNAKRSLDKKQVLTDRELKDVVINAIDGIKKNRAKDLVRNESKPAATDEMKGDKKNISSTEQNIFRRIESSDSLHFEKFSSADKNPDREGFNYNSSKTDFSAKSGLDKIEHNMKMPDFKENLQEIIDKAKITVRDNRNGAFIVKLNPQELGNVNVNLIMKNGVITGKFLVDNEDVRNILINSLQELKYQLQEAGIEVGEFSVGVDSRHERNLSSNIDETFVFPASDSEEIAAAEIYNTAAEVHTGHINLII